MLWPFNPRFHGGMPKVGQVYLSQFDPYVSHVTCPFADGIPISVFNFAFADNHMPVALLRQAHIAMAEMGGIPARFGSSDDLLDVLRTSHLRCDRPELSAPLRYRLTAQRISDQRINCSTDQRTHYQKYA